MNSFIGNILENTISKSANQCGKEVLNKLKMAEAIVIWGTGAIGENAFKYYNSLGIKFACFADNNKSRDNATFMGLPVIHADKFFESYKSVCIIIAVNKRTVGEIEKQLVERGYTDIIPYNIDFSLRLDDIDANRKMLESNAEEIDYVYGLLSDEKSKHVFSTLMKYRLSLDDTLIEEIYDKNQYFNNDIIGTFQGTFVDCGAFNGDTLKNMLSWDKGSYDKYYAFEPDKENYLSLEKYCEPLRNVYAKNMGVWNKRETMFFENSGTASSSINSIGTTPVEVDSIDNMFQNNVVDFIKMDIEGSESEALMGSKEVISKHAPILAISIYHKPEDLWKIPKLINELNNGYKIMIRHYESSAAESVCYAINTL